MATVTPTAVRRYQSAPFNKDVIVTWNGVKSGDVCAWFSEPGMVLRGFGVSGTFGAAGTVDFRVSGVDAIPASGAVVDPTVAQADETTLTGMAALNSAQFLSNANYAAAPSYRPRVNGGDGNTSLKIQAYYVAD